MPVSALELKPRGAIALFDAAIRLSSRSSGLWAISLCGGAVVAGSALHWTDQISHHRPAFVPSLLLAGAWLVRGVCQGAACHFVNATVLGPGVATVRASLGQALRRLPSLFIAVAYLSFFNLLSLTLTLGLGFFFLSSHAAGYAVTMQGKGHPLALYQTCSRLLGAARGGATGLRLLAFAQLLLILNLHIGASVLIYLARKLLGLDLTFAQRFASFDNAVWVAAIAAVGFALFEPLRAAAATLLLVDGRVRQEGIDLLAAVEQLPHRLKRTRLGERTAQGAALAFVLFGVGLTPQSSHAATGVELRQRFAAVAQRCGVSGTVLTKQLDAIEELAPVEHASLSRLLEDVESTAYDDDNCSSAAARLKRALPLIVQTRDELRTRGPDPRSAAQKAQAILARQEFTPDPEVLEKPKPEDAQSDSPGLMDRFWRWLGELLKKLFDSTPERSKPLAVPMSGDISAHLLVVVLVVAVVIALLYLLLSGRRTTRARPELSVNSQLEAPLSEDPNSALSRPPEGWAELADRLASQGQFREALRSLYLALLAKLHHLGAIDYDPALSNWDYLRAFKGDGSWLPPFRELTRRFDFAYYGHLAVDREGYSAFRTLTQPLLAPSAEAAIA